MTNYVAIAIRNNKKEITGYNVKYRTTQAVAPKGGGYEILRGVETDFPKAVQVGKEWTVVEDANARNTKEQKEQQKENRKQELIAALDNIDSLTLVQLKTLISKVLRHLLNL
jgi:hypothetical protein